MLYLASKSPRRAELLQRLGLSHRLLDVDVPEVRAPGEGAADYVRRVARDKARAGWSLVAGEPGARVLGADTEVVLDEEVFGKPADAADAVRLLGRLVGRAHEVLTGVALVASDAPSIAQTRVVASRVVMRRASEDEIRRYVATGEPLDKAGAYAAQGEGRRFIEAIHGSETNVIGLPMDETLALLRAAGHSA